jgi:hypothetical protein
MFYYRSDEKDSKIKKEYELTKQGAELVSLSLGDKLIPDNDIQEIKIDFSNSDFETEKITTSSEVSATPEKRRRRMGTIHRDSSNVIILVIRNFFV